MLVLHPLLQFFNSTRCFLFHCPTFICYIISFFSHRFLQWDHGTIYHTVPCKKKKKQKEKPPQLPLFVLALKKTGINAMYFITKCEHVCPLQYLASICRPQILQFGLACLALANMFSLALGMVPSSFPNVLFRGCHCTKHLRHAKSSAHRMEVFVSTCN